MRYTAFAWRQSVFPLLNARPNNFRENDAASAVASGSLKFLVATDVSGIFVAPSRASERSRIPREGSAFKKIRRKYRSRTKYASCSLLRDVRPTYARACTFFNVKPPRRDLGLGAFNLPKQRCPAARNASLRYLEITGDQRNRGAHNLFAENLRYINVYMRHTCVHARGKRKTRLGEFAFLKNLVIYLKHVHECAL